MLSPKETAWCDYIKATRLPLPGLLMPNGGDMCTATSNRPALDPSPDLTVHELAEAVKDGMANDRTRLECVPQICRRLQKK